jgi:hypothetical protein
VPPIDLIPPKTDLYTTPNRLMSPPKSTVLPKQIVASSRMTTTKTDKGEEALARGMAAATSDKRAVVLYDGVCNVCNSSVFFAMRFCGPIDEQRVLFASLQSEVCVRAAVGVV